MLNIKFQIIFEWSYNLHQNVRRPYTQKNQVWTKVVNNTCCWLNALIFSAEVPFFYKIGKTSY
jgi:hypothetical protein